MLLLLHDAFHKDSSLIQLVTRHQVQRTELHKPLCICMRPGTFAAPGWQKRLLDIVHQQAPCTLAQLAAITLVRCYGSHLITLKLN